MRAHSCNGETAADTSQGHLQPRRESQPGNGSAYDPAIAILLPPCRTTCSGLGDSQMIANSVRVRIDPTIHGMRYPDPESISCFLSRSAAGRALAG